MLQRTRSKHEGLSHGNRAEGNKVFCVVRSPAHGPLAAFEGTIRVERRLAEFLATFGTVGVRLARLGVQLSQKPQQNDRDNRGQFGMRTKTPQARTHRQRIEIGELVVEQEPAARNHLLTRATMRITKQDWDLD